MVGLEAMKELARLLDLKEFDINFNPGGIAVSGDLRLMGMWSEGSGAKQRTWPPAEDRRQTKVAKSKPKGGEKQ